MTERSFDEMIAYFNRRVADMDINKYYKIELLGIVTALGFKHKKSAQRWISCSERMPEENREILVTEKGGFIRHCEYANYGDFQEFQTVEEGLTVHDVLAWMPLPEPYKEGEKE